MRDQHPFCHHCNYRWVLSGRTDFVVNRIPHVLRCPHGFLGCGFCRVGWYLTAISIVIAAAFVAALLEAA